MRFAIFPICAAMAAGCAAAQKAVPIEEAAGPMRFEIATDRRGECRWNLISSNGSVIAKSSEGYKSRQSCDRSIELARGAASATVSEAE
jgi:uncharacterized protein YegP (UPF0339 family)